MAATRILNRTIGSSLAAMLLALSAWPALAGPWMVTVDTAPLQGQAGFLAFDYLAGDPATTNQVQLSAFASNAGLGAASSSGDVTGTLVPGPLRLGGGAQLFSEWLQGVNAFGNTISFVLDLGADSAANRPDQFAFFLLDPDQLPFATTDPTGAGALFYFDLTGAGTAPVTFTSAFASVNIQMINVGPPGVAEPGTGLLIVAACVTAILPVSRRRQPRRGALPVVC